MNQTKLRKLAKELSLEGSEETIPKGWIRREELCKILGFRTDYVCRFIKNLRRTSPSKVHSKRFKVRNTAGGISSVPYYKITL